VRVRNLLRLKELRDLLDRQNEILEKEVRARTATLQRFRSAMDAAGDAILLVDGTTRRFVEVNATATLMFGYSRSDFLGLGSAELGATTQIELERLCEAIVGGQSSELLTEVKIRRHDGWHLPVEIHRHVHQSDGDSLIVGVVRDITERKEASQSLYQMAHYDALTGLPNRRRFYETLAKTLVQAQLSSWRVAVLCVDLDHFKRVNDTYGHATGDLLLGQASERILKCIRLRDSVGRLGGDEFAVLLTMNEGRERAEAIALRIREALARPFTLGAHEVSITASVGFASYPADAVDHESLIKCADTAMYSAKQRGRDSFCIFAPQMTTELDLHLGLDEALRMALKNDEFVIHYQPKVDLGSGGVVGLEALLRWQRPGHGLVTPNSFIPALEESGLIVPVGNWVISTVCKQISEWSSSSIGPVQISVNVSGLQFEDHDLEGEVDRALLESGIDAGLLELELTESSLMQNTEATIATLMALKARGVQLSIDDFGTGYSSLAYLHRFPIDKVKIDIAFIRSITGDEGNSTIAHTIIRMAHSLRMQAIAEGVETAEQLEYLREHGCDQIQGYYFSAPLPVREMGELLREGRRLPVSVPPAHLVLIE
jgi:diguanylate cyclase (GGDEF)-like protein/PAS domain S-box-containing protein